MIVQLADKALKLIGGRAGAIAIGIGLALMVLMSFTIKIGLNTIEDQARKITQLEVDLRTEKQLRQSDISGLTSLVDGLVSVQRDSDLDQGALEHALDVSKPQPLSPFMRAFFECLRNNRNGEACSSVTPDPGAASGTD